MKELVLNLNEIWFVYHLFMSYDQEILNQYELDLLNKVENIIRHDSGAEKCIAPRKKKNNERNNS